MREWLRNVRVVLVAAAAIILGIFLYGWRRYRQGVATGEAEAGAAKDIERVREAEEAGDDDAVLREWRRHNR